MRRQRERTPAAIGSLYEGPEIMVDDVRNFAMPTAHDPTQQCVEAVPEKIIFLDIDGVLNAHERFSNGYAKPDAEAIYNMNLLLAEHSNAKIVVSSAWRYMVLGGAMTTRGLEYFLLSFGLECERRVIGVTGSDEDFDGDWNEYRQHWTTLQFQKFLAERGCAVRAYQIHQWLRLNQGWRTFVAIDDMPLPIKNLVRTDGTKGMRHMNIRPANKGLNGEHVDISEEQAKESPNAQLYDGVSDLEPPRAALPA
jgi:hypothetical protein